jgi:hypothetical protein
MLRIGAQDHAKVIQITSGNGHTPLESRHGLDGGTKDVGRGNGSGLRSPFVRTPAEIETDPVPARLLSWQRNQQGNQVEG